MCVSSSSLLSLIYSRPLRLQCHYVPIGDDLSKNPPHLCKVPNALCALEQGAERALVVELVARARACEDGGVVCGRHWQDAVVDSHLREQIEGTRRLGGEDTRRTCMNHGRIEECVQVWMCNILHV